MPRKTAPAAAASGHASIPHARVILGLGSNLGDREAHLKAAITALKKMVSGVQCSAVYESRALLPLAAPAVWNMPYLNMVVTGTTELAPRALLKEVKKLESVLGRKPSEYWSPREIDIDILAYGDAVVSEADLSIPHAALHERDFVLVPLMDIAPDWVYPAAGRYGGRTARELLQSLSRSLTRTGITVP